MTPRPGTAVSATAERDGIRITLELDRDRIAHGERAWADVTVTNIGTGDLFWGHSSTCVFPAQVSVLTEDALDLGSGRDVREWAYLLAVLKSATLYARSSWASGDAVTAFTPELFVDAGRNMGCTTDLVVDAIPPGSGVTHRAAWDAEALWGLPIPPDDYRIEAVFYYMSRGEPPSLEATGIDHEVRVDLPVVVDSPAVDYLGPGEAVDRVLENESFTALFAEAPQNRWTASQIRFEHGDWVMRLYLASPSEAIVVTVDAVTGEVLDVVLDPDPGEPNF
jgi:hypothetical protein